MAVIVANYEIEACIGRGGMAEVHRARVLEGPRAGTPVAVKRLLPALARDPEQVRHFAREARLAAQLHHPAIVEVLEIVEHRGAPLIVMEYVDGSDLRRLLARLNERGILFPVDFALYAVQTVAEGLKAAHEARGEDGQVLGVIHCDVSPSNIFVSRAGEVKIGDFGVARATGDMRRVAYGKVRYLSPEQLRNEPVTARTDVFGLGAVLYELLTGAKAFPEDDPDETVRHILSGRRHPPSSLRPEVSEEVDALVLRALADRGGYPHAGAFAAELGLHFDPGVGNRLAIAAVVRGLLAA